MPKYMATLFLEWRELKEGGGTETGRVSSHKLRRVRTSFTPGVRGVRELERPSKTQVFVAESSKDAALRLPSVCTAGPEIFRSGDDVIYTVLVGEGKGKQYALITKVED